LISGESSLSSPPLRSSSISDERCTDILTPTGWSTTHGAPVKKRSTRRSHNSEPPSPSLLRLLNKQHCHYVFTSSTSDHHIHTPFPSSYYHHFHSRISLFRPVLSSTNSRTLNIRLPHKHSISFVRVFLAWDLAMLSPILLPRNSSKRHTFSTP